MKRTKWLAATAVCLSLLLTGCGGSKTPGPSVKADESIFKFEGNKLVDVDEEKAKKFLQDHNGELVIPAKAKSIDVTFDEIEINKITFESNDSINDEFYMNSRKVVKTLILPQNQDMEKVRSIPKAEEVYLPKMDVITLNTLGDLQEDVKVVHIPEGLTKVEEFGILEDLETLKIPDSVTEMGPYAISDMPKLKEVTFPNNKLTFKFGTPLLVLPSKGEVKVVFPDKFDFDDNFKKQFEEKKKIGERAYVFDVGAEDEPKNSVKVTFVLKKGSWIDQYKDNLFFPDGKYQKRVFEYQ